MSQKKHIVTLPTENEVKSKLMDLYPDDPDHNEYGRTMKNGKREGFYRCYEWLVNLIGQQQKQQTTKAKIEGKELTEEHYLCPVTYVPNHADGNAGHADAEQGVLIRWDDEHAFVLYCKGRKVARTDLSNLVFG